MARKKIPKSASQQAQSSTIPAPVGGWDAQNAISEMPADHAYILDNWFPETDACRLRRGHSSYATGMTGAVESLLVYNGAGTNKMFAAANNKVYNVSSAGAVGGAVLTGKTNNRWESINISTVAGNFMLMVNGADTPQTYDGTNWAGTTITGPTTANLAWLTLHQGRVWTGEKNTLKAWYGPPNSIGGAFSSFDIGALCKRGGYIMAAGTWTRDGGDGTDDVLVFMTSEGEAVLYRGINPSDTNNWELIGVFHVGKPIGRRCMVKGGSDLIAILENGFVPLSNVLSIDTSQIGSYAISQQINNAVNDAIQSFGTLFGWQPILYPRNHSLIFNIPQSATLSYQYVFNTMTKAPCRFTGMNAACWAVYNGYLYFGAQAGGIVYLADDGTSDAGSAIMGDALQAFNNFGASGTLKGFLQARPLFLSDNSIAVAVEMNTDFQVAATAAIPVVVASNASTWDTSLWDAATWTAADAVYRGWYSVTGIGVYGSLRVRISTSAATVRWVNTQYRYAGGGQV